jgi:hypothetical protein
MRQLQRTDFRTDSALPPKTAPAAPIRKFVDNANENQLHKSNAFGGGFYFRRAPPNSQGNPLLAS